MDIILRQLTAIFLVFSFSFIYSSLGVASIPESANGQLNSEFCQNPSGKDCSFYSTCLESAQSCGGSGYALGYGEPYCRKFKRNEKLLSSRGQSFSVQTRKCLMQALVPRMNLMIAKSEAYSCSSTTKFAYSTHVACYVNHADSICELSPLTDLPIILAQFKLKDVLLKAGRTQVFEISKICLGRLLNLKAMSQNAGTEYDATDLEMKIQYWQKSLQDNSN